MTNLALLSGELSSPPEIRLLQSGSRLALLQVRARSGAARCTNVPVAVWDPPDAVETMIEGDEVIVAGRVERRFFRTGDGRTASRVEVVATGVALAGDRRRRAAVLRRVARALGEIDG